MLEAVLEESAAAAAIQRRITAATAAAAGPACNGSQPIESPRSSRDPRFHAHTAATESQPSGHCGAQSLQEPCSGGPSAEDAAAQVLEAALGEQAEALAPALLQLWAAVPLVADCLKGGAPYLLAAAPTATAVRFVGAIAPLLPASADLTTALLAAAADMAARLPSTPPQQEPAKPAAASRTPPPAATTFWGIPAPTSGLAGVPGATQGPSAALPQTPAAGQARTGARRVVITGVPTPEPPPPVSQTPGSVSWGPGASAFRSQSPSSSAFTAATMAGAPSMCDSLFSLGSEWGDGCPTPFSVSGWDRTGSWGSGLGHGASGSADEPAEIPVGPQGHGHVHVVCEVLRTMARVCGSVRLPGGAQGAAVAHARAALASLIGPQAPAYVRDAALKNISVWLAKECAAASGAQPSSSVAPAWVLAEEGGHVMQTVAEAPSLLQLLQAALCAIVCKHSPLPTAPGCNSQAPAHAPSSAPVAAAGTNDAPVSVLSMALAALFAALELSKQQAPSPQFSASPSCCARPSPASAPLSGVQAADSLAALLFQLVHAPDAQPAAATNTAPAMPPPGIQSLRAAACISGPSGAQPAPPVWQRCKRARMHLLSTFLDLLLEYPMQQQPLLQALSFAAAASPPIHAATGRPWHLPCGSGAATSSQQGGPGEPSCASGQHNNNGHVQQPPHGPEHHCSCALCGPLLSMSKQQQSVQSAEGPGSHDDSARKVVQGLLQVHASFASQLRAQGTAAAVEAAKAAVRTVAPPDTGPKGAADPAPSKEPPAKASGFFVRPNRRPGRPQFLGSDRQNGAPSEAAAPASVGQLEDEGDGVVGLQTPTWVVSPAHTATLLQLCLPAVSGTAVQPHAVVDAAPGELNTLEQLGLAGYCIARACAQLPKRPAHLSRSSMGSEAAGLLASCAVGALRAALHAVHALATGADTADQAAHRRSTRQHKGCAGPATTGSAATRAATEAPPLGKLLDDAPALAAPYAVVEVLRSDGLSSRPAAREVLGMAGSLAAACLNLLASLAPHLPSAAAAAPENPAPVPPLVATASTPAPVPWHLLPPSTQQPFHQQQPVPAAPTQPAASPATLQSVLQQLCSEQELKSAARTALYSVHPECGRTGWLAVARGAVAHRALGTALALLISMDAVVHALPSPPSSSGSPGVSGQESLGLMFAQDVVPATLALAAGLAVVENDDEEGGDREAWTGAAAAASTQILQQGGKEGAAGGAAYGPRGLGSLCGTTARHLLTGLHALPALLGPSAPLLQPLVRLACSSGSLGAASGITGYESAAMHKVDAGSAVICAARLMAQVLRGQAQATGFHLLCPLLLLRRLPGERATAAAAHYMGSPAGKLKVKGKGAGQDAGQGERSGAIWRAAWACKPGVLGPKLAANTVARLSGALWRRLRYVRWLHPALLSVFAWAFFSGLGLLSCGGFGWDLNCIPSAWATHHWHPSLLYVLSLRIG